MRFIGVKYIIVCYNQTVFFIIEDCDDKKIIFSWDNELIAWGYGDIDYWDGGLR